MARSSVRRIDKNLDREIEKIMIENDLTFREASREVAKIIKPKIGEIKF